MPNKLLPKDKVEELLPKLNVLIKKLSTTLPCGSKDGPLAKYFTSLEYDNGTALTRHSISYGNMYFNNYLDDVHTH